MFSFPFFYDFCHFHNQISFPLLCLVLLSIGMHQTLCAHQVWNLFLVGAVSMCQLDLGQCKYHSFSAVLWLENQTVALTSTMVHYAKFNIMPQNWTWLLKVSQGTWSWSLPSKAHENKWIIVHHQPTFTDQSKSSIMNREIENQVSLHSASQLKSNWNLIEIT